MKLSAALLLGVATLVSCAPQEFTPEAEVVEPVSTRGGDAGDGDYDTDYYDPDYSLGFGPGSRFPPRRFIFLNLTPSTDQKPESLHSIFRRLFTSLFSGPGGEDDQTASDDDFPFPAFDSHKPDDYPDNYANETHHVHDINGTRVEVNRTITKKTGDFGTFFHNLQVVRFVPDWDDDGDAGTGGQDDTVIEEEPQEVPQEDPAKNQEPHVRRRRWLANFARSFLGDLLLRNYPAEAPKKKLEKEFGELEELGEMRAPRLSYEGDTDVNFRTSNLRDEPDAQDFRAMSMRRDPKR